LTEKIGVIGLGNMGGAMSANLAKKGFEVYGYDPLEARQAELRGAGGKIMTQDEIAKNCGIIILALPSVKALEENIAVITSLAKPGTIILETSTLPVDDKIRLNKTLEGTGIIMLDAPLSGTGAMAKTANITVFVSGDEAAANKVVPVIEAVSRGNDYLGEFGNGMKMKCAANLMVALHNVVAAEGMLLATRFGLTAQMVYDVLSKSAATSRMFEVRGPMMVKGVYEPPSFTIRLMKKDLDIIHEAVQSLGAATPLFETVLSVYDDGLKTHPDQDTAAVYAVLDNRSKRGS